MNTSVIRTSLSALKGISRRCVATGPATLVALMLTLALTMAGCARSSSAAPREFKSPDEALGALTRALRADDTPELLAIMGSEGEQIVLSGDEVADRARRQTFLTLFDERHALLEAEPDARTLVVGPSDWPFPVPIVRAGTGWIFDAEAGREEILNRRIGENELSAIQVCKAIGDAQQEYWMRDPDGDGVREYARKFASDEGARNGLYWPAAAGDEPSPLGNLAAQANQEGYSRRAEGPSPYHGYYYRIIEAQGPNAPDGALQYVVNGKMLLGFAVVAYPAEYDSSGIMTFIMSADGVLHQKDLGEETLKLASEMKSFDPGPGWTRTD